MELSEWLAVQLRDRGWSVREGEKQTGISKSELSDIANGKLNPGLALMIRLARGFDTPLWKIMNMAGHDSGVNDAISEHGERIVSLLQARPDLAPVLERLPLVSDADIHDLLSYMESRVREG